jgi:hypothetical protein
LPRAPQTPLSLVAQEIPPETEQNLAPAQEVRHEVCMHLTLLSSSFSMNHS